MNKRTPPRSLARARLAKLARTIVPALALALHACSAMHSAQNKQVREEELTGCYVVEYYCGQYPGTIPAQISLENLPLHEGVGNWELGRFIAQSAGLNARVVRPAAWPSPWAKLVGYWTLTDGGEVAIHWASTTDRIVLRLRRENSNLRGTARFLTDRIAERPEEFAVIALAPTTCPNRDDSSLEMELEQENLGR